MAERAVRHQPPADAARPARLDRRLAADAGRCRSERGSAAVPVTGSGWASPPRIPRRRGSGASRQDRRSPGRGHRPDCAGSPPRNGRRPRTGSASGPTCAATGPPRSCWVAAAQQLRVTFDPAGQRLTVRAGRGERVGTPVDVREGLADPDDHRRRPRGHRPGELLGSGRPGRRGDARRPRVRGLGGPGSAGRHRHAAGQPLDPPTGPTAHRARPGAADGSVAGRRRVRRPGTARLGRDPAHRRRRGRRRPAELATHLHRSDRRQQQRHGAAAQPPAGDWIAETKLHLDLGTDTVATTSRPG